NDSSDGLGCYGVRDLADWIIEWNEAVIPSVEQYEICLFTHLDAANLFVPLAASRAIDGGHAKRILGTDPFCRIMINELMQHARRAHDLHLVCGITGGRAARARPPVTPEFRMPPYA